MCSHQIGSPWKFAFRNAARFPGAETAACLLLVALLSAPRLAAQEPLFAFAQTSDSQPREAAHQNRFEEVVEALLESGQPGALLRERVAFVLFAGDLVDRGTSAEWNTFMQTIAPLAQAEIALLAVPGNHDRTGGGLDLYRQYIGSTRVWDHDSSAVLGHNGVTWNSAVTGLRFIGVNNADSGEISNTDKADVQARIAFAEAQEENVFLLAHFPHDDQATPLRSELQSSSFIGYLRGHTGDPWARPGLVGVNNPRAWDLNSNSIKSDGALIYYEVFPGEVRAYVLEIKDNPSSLPSPAVLTLEHELRLPAPPDPGEPSLTLLPLADSSVRMEGPPDNFGHDDELRADADPRWRSYLEFDLPPLGGADVLSAHLRLRVTNSSVRSGAVRATSNSWSEDTITRANAPALSDIVHSLVEPAAIGEWKEFDVTSLVQDAALVHGTALVSFGLTSGSSNSVRYSSREGDDPPELSIELDFPLLVDSVTPAEVELLVPGVDQTITLTGAGFLPETTLTVDGAPLAGNAFTIIDAGTLTLDMPEVPLGISTITVLRQDRSASIEIEVVLPALPRLQVGQGLPSTELTAGETGRVLLAGTPSANFVILASPLLEPSRLPYVTLGIGAQFTDILLLELGTLPPTGLQALDIPVVVSTPMTVYVQAATYGVTGVRASNIQAVVLSTE